MNQFLMDMEHAESKARTLLYDIQIKMKNIDVSRHLDKVINENEELREELRNLKMKDHDNRR